MTEVKSDETLAASLFNHPTSNTGEPSSSSGTSATQTVAEDDAADKLFGWTMVQSDGTEPAPTKVEKEDVFKKAAIEAKEAERETEARMGLEEAPVDTAAIRERLNLDDSEASTAFAELAGDAEKGNKLLDMHEAANERARVEMTEAWAEETSEQFTPAEIEAVKEVYSKFATPELGHMLNATGLGNHPEIIQFLLNVSRGE